MANRLDELTNPTLDPTGGRAAATRVFVDGHAHFHDLFGWRAFLSAAARNLSAPAGRVAASDAGCVWLFGIGGRDPLGPVLAAARSDRTSGYELARTGESTSLWLRSRTSLPLILVAGCQVQAREGIEILAAGTADPIPDGLPARDAIVAAHERGAVAVIPWGVGKWTMRRRRVVTALLDDAPAPTFVGDTGNRLRWWPAPSLFGRAEAKGRWVLPGSDALPLRGHAARVGRYGFVLPARIDPAAPARSILDAVRALKGSPDRFGALEDLPGFMASLVALQWRKRVRR